MDTFLDLLIVVVLGLAAVSLVAIVLMFLVKNTKVRRVCLWLVAALGVYIGYVGIRINCFGFLPEMLLAGAMALAGIGAVVLERLSKGDEKQFLIARIMASAALVVGLLNAFM